jgi:hypothetical protein
MGIWFRSAWVVSLAWSLTACTGLPIGDFAHQTIPSLALSPIQAFDTGPDAIDYRAQSEVPISFNEPSMVLTAMPTGAFFGPSALHLSKSENGSISVLSDGRSVSLLRGLDPALVNPAVLPFLFPFCDVPFLPGGVAH